MLVLDRERGTIEHAQFTDFPGFFEAGDLVVVNNTAVIPVRVMGHKEKSGGRVELLFLEEATDGTWEVLLRASRRPAVGDAILLPDGESRLVLLADGERGRARVRVETGRPFMDVLNTVGEMPVPPYIKRGGDQREDLLAEDRERYQTVYARQPGAVAAPTAGLHFTPALFEQLRARGVETAEVTLHVGIGTFRPVATERVEEHRMEGERYRVSEETAKKIEATRRAGRRIVAVGSTTVRTLETVARDTGRVVAAAGRSDLFVYPPWQPKVIDVMLTNFHLPRSTLLMMVCAIAGRTLTMQAYEEAVKERYRFYSYGDCMLIL